MAGSDETPPDLPIRVYDMVAQGTVADGIDVADGRHIDLSVRDLQTLTVTLGMDGLRALCLYLEHLEHVPGHDGRPTLGVPNFSARWLIETSARLESDRGGVPLGKSAATRGQQAVEQSGLLRPLANPTAPGAGARGRTWRAVLGGRLELVPNTVDDDRPTPLRGRPRLSPVPLPVRRGKRQSAQKEDTLPVNQAKRDEPQEPFPGPRGSGPAGSASPLVKAAFVDPGMRGAATTSTSQSVVQQLLSSDTEQGLLRSRLVPALHSDRARTEARLYKVFNDTTVADRATGLLGQLQLPAASTERAQVLTTYLADLLLDRRTAVQDLADLNVSGPPLLDPRQLTERLVVGIVVGLGMKKVAAWGAWLHQATRPSWTPKPNQTIDRFTTTVLSMTTPGYLEQAHEPPPVAVRAGEPVTGRPAAPESAEREPTPPDVLPPHVVAEHLPAAQRRWPLFAREGTRQATDPIWQSRLVRMYLADLRNHSEGESEQTG